MKKLLFSLLLLSISGFACASVDTARFLQLVDYIGVDYPGAVQDGAIVNADEYSEMREFSATVLEQAQQLDATTQGANLTASARQLQQLISERADPAQVAKSSAAMRQAVLSSIKVHATPRNVPDLQSARTIFATQCASCHGAEGYGDGPLARTLEPAPTNFHDFARFRDRTLYGLYSTISIGVEGTGMQAYAGSLTEQERWSLAFFVGQLAVSAELAEQGAGSWSKTPVQPLADLDTLTTITPAEAEQRFGKQGLAQMAYLRHEPGAVFANKAPLGIARSKTLLSQASYTQGNTKLAYQQALSAYLDGFELAEPAVSAADHELLGEIETAMTGYREMIKHSAPLASVQAQATHVLGLLDRASEAVASKSLSSGAAFSGSFIILVREGLEALLVVAALAAFLVKTNRRDGLLYLHLGWVFALLLGVATWLGSQYLFDFSGSSREVTEGLAAIIAMLVLFYVGFWLHSKTAAAQWKRFIEESVNKALDSGTMWAIAGLSFIAVYREVFETILFYQAMWVQAEHTAQASLVGGVVAGAATLFILAWLMLRYSTRLPLRQFFSYTSVFMFVLAIIFAGKGIAALQEAGKVPFDPVNMPSIDLLGIYPNIEGLALQATLLVMALFILFKAGRKTTPPAAS